MYATGEMAATAQSARHGVASINGGVAAACHCGVMAAAASMAVA